MCKYCITDAQRSVYCQKAKNKKDGTAAELTLEIDDLDNGLLIQCAFNYYDEYKKKIIPMGITHKIDANYCPWCGRKLNDEK